MNELKPTPVRGTPGEHRRVSGRDRIRRGYAQYLQDESRMAAEGVEVIHFPTTAEQAAGAVRHAREAGHRLTVSGGRTGITGAAVPLDAEEVLSLEFLTYKPEVRRRGDAWIVRVGAGMTLDELSDALDHGMCEYPDGRPERPLYYPVDATEMSAHLGGTIATNASGARTFYYGPTRRWVEWLRVVTPDGRLLDLRRGDVTADGGGFAYRRVDGSSVEVPVANLPLPQTKHTAGYHLKPGMDAVDLFVGSEGTLGVIVEAELRLAGKPASRLYLTQFVPDAAAAMQLSAACTRHPMLEPLALEYIGPRALKLLRSKGRQTPAYMEVARLPDAAAAAVYVELPFADERALDSIYGALRAVLADTGLEPAESWAGFAERDLEEMKRLRHAVPEAINTIIGQRKADVPDLHKVGTDMAVPAQRLGEMIEVYRAGLGERGLEYVIFGHIGDGHLHVNILPRSAEELEAGEELYKEFARAAVRLEGSVAAEHGIGRLKKDFLTIQYAPEHLEAMRAVKRALDPDGILNPGVLFD